jgi:hypothetical protein
MGGLRDRLAASGFDAAQVAADTASTGLSVVNDVPRPLRWPPPATPPSGKPNVVVFDLAYDYRSCAFHRARRYVQR